MAVVSHMALVHGMHLTRQLAHTAIRRLGFTYKRTRKRGHSARVLAETPIFIERFLSVTGLMVAVDESGFDQRATPVYGWAPAGKQAIVKFRPCSDRKRWSLLMAIASDGSRTYTLSSDSVKGDAFAAFIQSLPFPPNTCILLDNASIHKTKSVTQAAITKGYNLLFTPPYCPEFNPIELVFGVIKNAFYKMRFSIDFPTGSSIRSAVVAAVAAGARPDGVAGSFRHVRTLIEAMQSNVPIAI